VKSTMEPNGGQIPSGVIDMVVRADLNVLETALAARFHCIPKPRRFGVAHEL
jgi:hypothetical protein